MRWRPARYRLGTLTKTRAASAGSGRSAIPRSSRELLRALCRTRTDDPFLTTAVRQIGVALATEPKRVHTSAYGDRSRRQGCACSDTLRYRVGTSTSNPSLFGCATRPAGGSGGESLDRVDEALRGR